MTDQARPLTFSYSAVWEDAGRMLSANAGLLTAVAGVFLFLPALLMARYTPEPLGAESWAEWFELMQIHLNENWHWLLLSTLVNMVGLITVFLLLLVSPRLTVGRAVVRALPILPFFYLVSLALNLAVGVGLIALIIGAVYLLGRLVLASPILVAEQPAAPITAIRDSWRRTKGRGWAIGGLLAIFYAAAMLVGFAVQVGLGTVILLLLGREGVGGLVLAILVAAVGAVMTMVGTVLIAAVYRAVEPRVERANCVV